MNWYVPDSHLRIGPDLPDDHDRSTYKPWYAGQYGSIEEVVRDYTKRHAELLAETEKFTRTFYDTDLPGVIVENYRCQPLDIKIAYAAAANRRQAVGLGRLCRHFWKLPWLLPACLELRTGDSPIFSPRSERTYRQVEFNEDMDEHGHQQFRTLLPIRKNTHDFHAASDGQPGGIMKDVPRLADFGRHRMDCLVLGQARAVHGILHPHMGP